MDVIDIVEHEDGSATYTFNLTDEENQVMCKNGILWALVCGITGLTVDEVMKSHFDKQEEVSP